MENKIMKLETLNVCNSEIDAIKDEKGNGFIVLKRICENLGMHSESERQKLLRSGWATTCMIQAVANDEKIIH